MTKVVKNLMPPGYSQTPYQIVLYSSHFAAPDRLTLRYRPDEPAVLADVVPPLLGSRIYNRGIMRMLTPEWVELVQEQLEEVVLK